MNKQQIKENFFEAVNGEWLKNHKIPADKVSVGAFTTLAKNMDSLKKRLLNKWQENNEEIKDNKTLLEMVKFYGLVKNWQARRRNGLKPTLKYLKTIEGFKSWKDVEENYNFLTLNGFITPLPFEVENDFLNSDIKSLVLEMPNCILPEKKYYTDKEKRNSLYGVWKGMVKKLLSKVNKDENFNNDLIEKAIAWDLKASQLLLPSEELVVYTKLYNPIQSEELAKNIKRLDVQKILINLIQTFPEKTILLNQKHLKEFGELINDSNFELYKAALYINVLLTLAQLCDYSSLVISGEFRRSLYGIPKAKSKEKTAINLVTDNYFNMPFGKYYGEKFFGAKNRETIENMIKKMVNIYQERLEKNTWLSSSTKERAIFKLNKMKPFIGYPDKIREFYKDFIVEEYEGFNDLLENTLKFERIVKQYKLDRIHHPSDKTLWGMSPADVNAYFSPTENKIVFPAAILQAPFYSSKQNSSANYGGIGMVIAHEISHGFDNNGANFDEVGNMKNWWTEEDKKEFDKRAQAMIDLFNGVETNVGKCNGKLTVSENIADAGGLSCALEAARTEKDFKIQDFYLNYAKSWRGKMRPEVSKLLLETDPHAPGILRVNVQVKNSDGFYEAFDIKEQDEMYLAPEKRVKIW